jgi:hypothetical protein
MQHERFLILVKCGPGAHGIHAPMPHPWRQGLPVIMRFGPMLHAPSCEANDCPSADSPETRYATTTDGLAIAYQVLGERSPLVWTPGFAADVKLFRELPGSPSRALATLAASGWRVGTASFGGRASGTGSGRASRGGAAPRQPERPHPRPLLSADSYAVPGATRREPVRRPVTEDRPAEPFEHGLSRDVAVAS